MLSEQLFQLSTEAIYLALLCSALPLAAALLCGLAVSVFQAATQIQEQTLSFVPKLAAVAAALWLSGPFLTEHVSEFLSRTHTELESLHEYPR